MKEGLASRGGVNKPTGGVGGVS